MTPSPLKILVPQGAEYQAVRKGIQQAVSHGLPKLSKQVPSVIPIPVGPEPVTRFLKALQTGSNPIICPFQPEDVILLMGLGGSLSPELDMGAVTLIEHCVADWLLPNHENLTPPPTPNDPAPLDQQGITGDRPFLHWLQQSLDTPVILVRGITSTRVINTAEEKAQLYQTFSAAIVEMEGYSVLEFCQSHQLRGAILRVVGDRSDHDIPDISDAIGPDGTLRPLALTCRFLQHPIAATHLIRGSLAGLTILRQTASQITTALMTPTE